MCPFPLCKRKAHTRQPGQALTAGQRKTNARQSGPTSANGIVENSSFLSGYYDDYAGQVWQMYESTTLTVDT